MPSLIETCEQVVQPGPPGLSCPPGGLVIDPRHRVELAVITHGHSDHARPGHETVVTSRETAALMVARYGPRAACRFITPDWGEPLRLGTATISLYPAGHVLGSAQVLIEAAGVRVVVAGDYKRRPDPTCAPFQPVACDVFITEATFGLPLFRFPPVEGEIKRLLDSLALFPERCHLVAAYSLGKAQRLIALLRAAGWSAPIHIHPSLVAVSAVYQSCGVDLGPLAPLAAGSKVDLAGTIVLAPPGSVAGQVVDPVTCAASGWLMVPAEARHQRVDLPLVISDHADWPELTTTLSELRPAEVWITHGRPDALGHWASGAGIKARALDLIGRTDSDGD